MKKPLLFLAAFCCYYATSAQTVVASENFDACADGDFAAVCSPVLTTWDLMPGGSADALVSSTQAAMGLTSMHITGPAGGGPTDMVMELGDRTGGIYKLEFYIYVEQGAGGYFNILHEFDPGTNSFEWALDVFFSMDGTGSIDADGAGAASFTYTNAAWNHVTIDMDLETAMAELTIAGTSVHTWPFDTQGGGGAGLNQLAAANFYSTAPAGEASDYYIDEIVFTEVSGVGINEANGSASVGAYPNPATDVMTIELAGFDASTATMQLIDVTGKTVGIDLPTINSADQTLQLDVDDLPSGIYFLSVSDGAQELVEKVVIQ